MGVLVVVKGMTWAQHRAGRRDRVPSGTLAIGGVVKSRGKGPYHQLLHEAFRHIVEPFRKGVVEGFYLAETLVVVDGCEGGSAGDHEVQRATDSPYIRTE